MARFIWAKYVFRRKYRDLFGQNSLPLQRFVSITATSVFLISNISSMGRPKRLYPLGRYRLHVRGEIDPAKQYLVQLEYTWNRQVIRKGMNIFVRLGDWNEKANKGRGGVRRVMVRRPTGSTVCCLPVRTRSTDCWPNIRRSIPIRLRHR